MKVLVTGGSGFIGSHLVEALVKRDDEVTVLDVWQSEDLDPLVQSKVVNFVKGSVFDCALIEKLFEGQHAVIHLAAVLGTAETIEVYNPKEVAEVNILGTLNVLETARRNRISRVVLASTPDVPWLNPYKITKRAMEQFALMYHREYDVPASILRLTNVYGPRERTTSLRSDAAYNYQKVVPTFIVAAILGKPLPIFGDGEQKSEYVYVNDIVRSILLALSREEAVGTVIPIGTGIGVSVNELAQLVLQKTGSKSGMRYFPMRRGEVKVEIKTDTSVAKGKIGFEYEVDLDNGLNLTLPYYIKKFN